MTNDDLINQRLDYSETLLKAAEEIERLRKLVALWEECADLTMKTFGNVIRPQYVEKVRQEAERIVKYGIDGPWGPK